MTKYFRQQFMFVTILSFAYITLIIFSSTMFWLRSKLDDKLAIFSNGIFWVSVYTLIAGYINAKAHGVRKEVSNALK